MPSSRIIQPNPAQQADINGYANASSRDSSGGAKIGEKSTMKQPISVAAGAWLVDSGDKQRCGCAHRPAGDECAQVVRGT